MEISVLQWFEARILLQHEITMMQVETKLYNCIFKVYYQNIVASLLHNKITWLNCRVIGIPSVISNYK